MTHDERRDRRKRIVEAVRKGADPLQVGMDEHVSWSTVQKACREAGVGADNYPQRLSTIERNFEIVAQLRTGKKTLREIGKSVGLTTQRVAQIETLAMEKGLLSPR